MDDAKRIRELQAVLRAARDKLVRYREQHSGEYVGGMEYTALIKRIDAVLPSPWRKTPNK